MIIIVGIVGHNAIYDPNNFFSLKKSLEAVSGEQCTMVPYFKFGMKSIREHQPEAVVISGFPGRISRLDVKWFHGMNEVFQRVDIPILAICGGHQVLAFCHNRDITKAGVLPDLHIRRLGEDEDFPRQSSLSQCTNLAEYFVADGFFPIRKRASDPLFEGLPEWMYMRCAHFCEVKTLPPGFRLLASSAHSPIEAMKHEQKCQYGVQFHPERNTHPFLHGRLLLENFWKIARGRAAVEGEGALLEPKQRAHSLQLVGEGKRANQK